MPSRREPEGDIYEELRRRRVRPVNTDRTSFVSRASHLASSVWGSTMEGVWYVRLFFQELFLFVTEGWNSVPWVVKFTTKHVVFLFLFAAVILAAFNKYLCHMTTSIGVHLDICTTQYSGYRDLPTFEVTDLELANSGCQSMREWLAKSLEILQNGLMQQEGGLSIHLEPEDSELWRQRYRSGIHKADELEKQLMGQQKYLWNTLRHYIDTYPKFRPQQSWAQEYLGWTNANHRRDALATTRKLHGIANNTYNQITTIHSIFAHSNKKLDNHLKGENYDKLDTNMEDDTLYSDSLEHKNLLANTVVWLHGTDTIVRDFAERKDRLEDDKNWFGTKLVTLQSQLDQFDEEGWVWLWGWLPFSASKAKEEGYEEIVRSNWKVAGEGMQKLKSYYEDYQW